MSRPFAATLGLLVLTAAPAAAEPFAVETETATFPSDGKAIRVETFLPKGQKNCPAIVLLHDSAGMTLVPATIFRQASRLMAGKGYVVFVVYYFDATGHTQLKAEEARQAEKHWPAWKTTVRDAVKYAGSHPQVDRDRIGMLGFSLGAYLSLAVATDRDLKIAAVAEFFGGLPHALRKDADRLRLPPTLIIHGKDDRIVPPQEADDLRHLLASRKVPFEIKVYNCGHLFDGTQLHWKNGGIPSIVTVDGDLGDARDRTVRFFARHLMEK